MTYITVSPKNSAAESLTAEASDTLCNLLRAATEEILQIPSDDIIVEMNRCTVFTFDQSAVDAGVAPDVVLTFATSDRHLQPKFSTLRDRVLHDWDGRFEAVRLEVWFTLIDVWGSSAAGA
ncbi:hypothetical protein ABC304_02330 [Microbacterium sp. 1P10UB]|uniref:hypothetical protein n=1 Tax=unclassified Microbacterium TaxID=2609290 RepID=UPI00399F7E78